MRRQTDNSLLTVPRCTNFFDAFLQRIRVSPMRLSTYLQRPSRVISVSRVGPKNGSRCRRIITKSVDSDRLRFTSSNMGYFSAHSLNVNGSDFPSRTFVFVSTRCLSKSKSYRSTSCASSFFNLSLATTRIRTQSEQSSLLFKPTHEAAVIERCPIAAGGLVLAAVQLSRHSLKLLLHTYLLFVFLA